jgi:hypothetical protein
MLDCSVGFCATMSAAGPAVTPRLYGIGFATADQIAQKGE